MRKHGCQTESRVKHTVEGHLTYVAIESGTGIWCGAARRWPDFEWRTVTARLMTILMLRRSSARAGGILVFQLSTNRPE
jgi:hypothetical protein